MIRVVIVDDSEIVRRGFRLVLERAGDIEIIGEARDGHEAIALAQELNPDVMTMDIQMPHLNGMRATEQINVRRANIRLVMVSSTYDQATVQQAFKIGATGYVAKPEAFDELVPAVRAVYKGKVYLSAALANVAAQIGTATGALPPSDHPPTGTD